MLFFVYYGRLLEAEGDDDEEDEEDEAATTRQRRKGSRQSILQSVKLPAVDNFREEEPGTSRMSKDNSTLNAAGDVDEDYERKLYFTSILSELEADEEADDDDDDDDEEEEDENDAEDSRIYRIGRAKRRIDPPDAIQAKIGDFICIFYHLV
ncbi:unnamed protein product [Protopolystoma xenopodis]|uniref:Uncharacterized protein n=1 Tax=Protopolystoma xenopodis TaxID=117903 RepID=A0A3S5A7M0_9PLAT|nr:unnamed protein product [Protopolystoma xenopodis]